MIRISLTEFRIARSDNRKSKIQNLKWAGIFAIAKQIGLTIRAECAGESGQSHKMI